MSSAFLSASGSDSLAQSSSAPTSQSSSAAITSPVVTVTSTPTSATSSNPLALIPSIIKEVDQSGTQVPDEPQNTGTTMSTSISSSAQGTAPPTSTDGPATTPAQDDTPVETPTTTPTEGATNTTPEGTSTSSKTTTVAAKPMIQSATSDGSDKTVTSPEGTTQSKQAAAASQKGQATNGNSQAPTSTSHKVTFVSGTTVPTGTSTVVDTPTPESTLSQPILSTVVSNGASFVVTPAWVTSLSTSTLPDGSFLTLTHVNANPTGLANGNLSDGGHSFFSNTGAVAGVFTALGIIAGITALGVVLFCRRRRREMKRREWIKTMKPHSPEDPFTDAASPTIPIMRTISVDNDGSSRFTNPNSPRNTIWSDEPQVPIDPQGVASGDALSSTGHGSNQGTFGQAAQTWPFVHQDPASGRSTPSVYPPSLAGKDDDSAYRVSLKDPGLSRQQDPFISPPVAASVPPPRPARSVFRDIASRPMELLYMTPPPSQTSLYSGKSTSARSPILDEVSEDEQPPSPVSDLGRRPTLLSVRPRPNREVPPSSLLPLSSVARY